MASRMRESLSGLPEVKAGRKGVAAAGGCGAATAPVAACTQAGEAAKTRGGIASPLGTVPRMLVTTIDSVTGLTTQDSRAEDRKAAAAVDTAGGSTVAVRTAGATPTNPRGCPLEPSVQHVDQLSYFFYFSCMLKNC
jgi:hypothetical protein